jgi:hypothetical protein
MNKEDTTLQDVDTVIIVPAIEGGSKKHQDLGQPLNAACVRGIIRIS